MTPYLEALVADCRGQRPPPRHLFCHGAHQVAEPAPRRHDDVNAGVDKRLRTYRADARGNNTRAKGVNHVLARVAGRPQKPVTCGSAGENHRIEPAGHDIAGKPLRTCGISRRPVIHRDDDHLGTIAAKSRRCSVVRITVRLHHDAFAADATRPEKLHDLRHRLDRGGRFGQSGGADSSACLRAAGDKVSAPQSHPQSVAVAKAVRALQPTAKTDSCRHDNNVHRPSERFLGGRGNFGVIREDGA